MHPVVLCNPVSERLLSYPAKMSLKRIREEKSQSLGKTSSEMLHSIVHPSVRDAKTFSSGYSFEINLEYMKMHAVKHYLLRGRDNFVSYEELCRFS